MELKKFQHQVDAFILVIKICPVCIMDTVQLSFQHLSVLPQVKKHLKKFNTQTKEFKSFTTENGLPSNSIAAIKGDENNNLWISTNYGISRFHIQSENIVSFYTRDGLQGNEFTKGAAFQGIRGDINFGGPGGVTFFNPQEIINPSKKPQIKISDFYVHDKAIHKGVKSGKEVIIDTNVSKAKEFHLSHLDNSFSIEFTAMEYYNPERITYQYNFNGNGWITLRNGENHVSFSDLEPNIYHLQVRAKDYNTYSDTIEVSIIISPLVCYRMGQITIHHGGMHPCYSHFFTNQTSVPCPSTNVGT